jgi:type VI secretion system protein ImpC
MSGDRESGDRPSAPGDDDGEPTPARAPWPPPPDGAPAWLGASDATGADTRAPWLAPPTEAPAPLEAIAAAPAASPFVPELCDLAGARDPAQRRTLAEGIAALVSYAARLAGPTVVVDVALVDLVIAELGDRLSSQIDEILHHRSFQELEAAWRGLKFVVDQVDFHENVVVEMLNVSKQDLRDDFQDAPEIPKSGLYRVVYSTEYGQFGGRPYGVILANFELAPTPQDVALLQQCAAVATMAHAPFIAAAAPQFFGLDDYRLLPQIKDLASLFEGPQYTKWRALRDSDDARSVGLVLPRMLMRLPYGPRAVRVSAFEYEERVEGLHGAYLWGSAVFAFALRLADAFARYRWCLHIVGPSHGTVEGMPLEQHRALGPLQHKIPTEIVVTERREWELAEQGFIPLTYRRETENASFFSANSVQRVRTFAQSKEGKTAELNFRLGAQLPYLFIVNRLAHYLKVLQREQVGTWKERGDLERELNKWLMQFTADQEVVAAAVRSRRPLRKARVVVSDVAGSAGWYRVDVQIQPHVRWMGAQFSVGVVGRLDKE